MTTRLTVRSRPVTRRQRVNNIEHMQSNTAKILSNQQEEFNPSCDTGLSRFWRLFLSYRNIPSLATGFDFLLIIVTGLISEASYHAAVFGGPGLVGRGVAVALFVALIFVVISRLNDLYSPTQLLLWNVQLNNTIWIWSVAFFLLSGWLFVWGAGKDVSRGSVISFWGIGLIALVGARAFWRVFLAKALKRGVLRGRRVVLIGPKSLIQKPGFLASLGRHGYEILHQFSFQNSRGDELSHALRSAIAFVRGSEVEEVLVALPDRDAAKVSQIVDRLRVLPSPVTWIADVKTAELVRQPWFELGSRVAVELQRAPLSALERAFKRVVDLTIAIAGLMLFAPVLAGAALSIKFDSEGPILFRQTRLGFNGKPFKITKFRSMYVMEDGDVIKQATKKDSRITRVGAWLRKTSIDELPQLLDVLRGDMSIVGPRPHAVAHDNQFMKVIADYAFRHHVKPGITGWAQVHGLRGETATNDKMQRRVDFDRWYVNNWSIWLDFLIILRTFGAIIPRENVY